jgi:hypothetical protein
MGNLKNKRKCIILPLLDTIPETENSAGESAEEDHGRCHYKREYTRNWQRQRRAKLSLLRATELADFAQMESSTVQSVGTTVLGIEGGQSTCQFQRETASLSRDIALVIFDHLKDSEELIRHEVLQKVLGHSLLKSSIPVFLQDMNLVKHSIEIVQNLSRGLNEHYTGVREQKLIMAKDIVCTLATANSSATSARQMAKLLGVDRRNFKKSFEWRQALDSSGDAFWVSYKRARRSNALTETVRDLVVQFWTTETTVSPNEKDITRLHVGVKKFVEHTKHYLQIS